MRGWLIPFGMLALVAAGVIWFLSAFERVPSKEWVGPSGEARRNPYLAAERFAARMGLQARQLRSLPELDALDPRGALLLPSRRQALDPRRVQQLVAWVDGGGHLIVEAELVGVSDPLLELLGVERSPVPRAAAKPLPVELPGGRKLAVSILGSMTLQAPNREPHFRVGTADAARVIAFEHGKGMVTAVTGLHFVRNNLIATNDNAEFVWHLLQLTPAPALEVFLRPERLSLWGFLKEHAASVLAAGAVLLVLWLWRTAPRFGPVRPDLPAARRRLLDHLRASGRFYWTQDLRGKLVIAARDAALRRISRAQPDFAQASLGERSERLAALLGIAPEEATRFMTAGDSVRGADFIRVVHTAQRVHSALERGNR